MKKRFLMWAVTAVMSFAMLTGCGKTQEVPAPQEPVSEASVEEASVQEEVPAEASSEEVSTEEEIQDARPTSLDDALGIAVIENNKDNYLAGEMIGEGHILMDKDGDEQGKQRCYVLAMYGWYEFEDGNFVKCSGSGAIPCVITLERNVAGEYNVVSYEEAEDGSGFVPSIKKLFPEKLWSRCITIDDDDRNELEKQERSYAEEYLSVIGREDAEIGDYSDFDHQILTDLGVDEEVANKMLDVRSAEGFEKNCPFWIGNREVFQGSDRYIYKMEYDKKAKEIIFSKVMYATDEVLESSVYDSVTGDKKE